MKSKNGEMNDFYGRELIKFCSYYKEHKEEFSKHIEMFSFFIQVINKEFVYNKTYLGSYLNDLDLFSKKIISKDGFSKYLYKYLSESKMKLKPTMKIRIDKFWEIGNDGINYLCLESDYIKANQLYLEIIQESCILSSKYLILINDHESICLDVYKIIEDVLRESKEILIL